MGRGRPFNPFSKQREAAQIYRALRKNGLSGKSAQALTEQLTGVDQASIRSADRETRPAKDGSGKGPKVDLTPLNDENAHNLAITAIIANNWVERAKQLGVWDLLTK